MTPGPKLTQHTFSHMNGLPQSINKDIYVATTTKMLIIRDLLTIFVQCRNCLPHKESFLSQKIYSKIFHFVIVKPVIPLTVTEKRALR